MAEITINDVIGQLLAVLIESFDGPQQSGYYTDEGPEGGLLGTLNKLNAKQASQSIGGTSIASHAYHTTFGLEASTALIGGDNTPRNWPDSWRVNTVDETTWKKMLDEMLTRYEELNKAIESNASSSIETFGGAIGAIAHVAYHLGAIRQKVAFSRHS